MTREARTRTSPAIVIPTQSEASEAYGLCGAPSQRHEMVTSPLNADAPLEFSTETLAFNLDAEPLPELSREDAALGLSEESLPFTFDSEALPELYIEDAPLNFSIEAQNTTKHSSSPLEQCSIFSNKQRVVISADSPYVNRTNSNEMTFSEEENQRKIAIFKTDLEYIKTHKAWIQDQGLSLDHLPEKSRGFLLGARIQAGDEGAISLDDYNLSDDFNQCLQRLCLEVLKVKNARYSLAMNINTRDKLLEHIERIIAAVDIKHFSHATLCFNECVKRLNTLTTIDLTVTQREDTQAIRGLVSAIVILKALEYDFDAIIHGAPKFKISHKGVQLVSNNKTWLFDQILSNMVLSKPTIELIKIIELLPGETLAAIDTMPDFEIEYKGYLRTLFESVITIGRPDFLNIIQDHGYSSRLEFITGYLKSLSIEDTSDLFQCMSEAIDMFERIIDLNVVHHNDDNHAAYARMKDCVAAILVIKAAQFCFSDYSNQLISELETESAAAEGDSDSQGELEFNLEHDLDIRLG